MMVQWHGMSTRIKGDFWGIKYFSTKNKIKLIV